MKKKISIFTILVLLFFVPSKNAILTAHAIKSVSGIHPVSIEETKIKTDRNRALKFFGKSVHKKSVFHGNFKKKVKLIVELTQPPLLDFYNQEMSDRSLDTICEDRKSYALYKKTKPVEIMENHVLLQQEETISEISDTIYKGRDIEIVDRFTNIINAFVMEGNTADIEAIGKLYNVKNVYISKTYERIKPIAASLPEKITGTGSDLMNADNLPYKGEGMLIAILDTGIDTNHEAFATAPKKQKYTKSDIDEIIINNKLASEVSENPITSSEDVYINDKIPYAYDYYYGNNDVNSSKEAILLGNDHGTHVAGIAAANSDTLTGIAPEAQLLIMKIFPDDGGNTPDFVYFKALEDCVTLGADVVNMSIGSACGYTDDNSEIDNEILNRIIKSGIILAVSASNNESSAANNAFGYNRALTINPDTSTVGSPSTNTAALSVASVENSVIYEPVIKLFDGTKIGVNDSSDSDSNAFINLIAKNREYEYVYVKSGLKEDYNDINTEGKIAVADRGIVTFQEKLHTAYTNGALGLIVINNVPGSINMIIDTYYIPAASITYTDGIKLLSQKNYTFTVSDYEFIPKKTAGQISNFSSWGVTPDLLLKPEITAVGGSVLSALPYNKYGNKGGTSMSSPQIAGISAVIKEYISKDHKYSSITKENLEHIVSSLLMSTAKPIKTSGYTVTGSSITVPYSPRRQGAGLVNAYAALNTKAVLYTTQAAKRPVLNLGDNMDESGLYTKSFHIRNYSDETLRYHLDSTIMTESCEVHESRTFIAETPTLLKSKASFHGTSVINTSGSAILSCFPSIQNSQKSDPANQTVHDLSGSELVLGPYEDIEITTTITLMPEDKDYIKSHFENGEFVEGFIMLTSLNADSINLNLPFTGFFGDWTKAPILDSATYYDDPEQEGYQLASNVPSNDTSSLDYYNNLSLLLGLYDGTEDYMILGQNPYNPIPPFNLDKIAISPNNDGILDSCSYWIYSPLRGSKTTEYIITDKSGCQIYHHTSNGDRKAIYDSKYKYFTKNHGIINWTGKGLYGRILPNNSVVKFTFKASLDFNVHETHNQRDTITLPITIDIQEPDLADTVLTKAKELYTFVSDNQYIAAAILYGYENNNVQDIIDGLILDETKKHTVSLLKFKLGNNIKKQYLLSLIDYAGNEGNYIIEF